MQAQQHTCTDTHGKDASGCVTTRELKELNRDTFPLAVSPPSKHLCVKQRRKAAERCNNRNPGFAGEPLPTRAAPDISEGIVSPSLGSLGLEEDSPWPHHTEERCQGRRGSPRKEQNTAGFEASLAEPQPRGRGGQRSGFAFREAGHALQAWPRRPAPSPWARARLTPSFSCAWLCSRGTFLDRNTAAPPFRKGTSVKRGHSQ